MVWWELLKGGPEKEKSKFEEIISSEKNFNLRSDNSTLFLEAKILPERFMDFKSRVRHLILF